YISNVPVIGLPFRRVQEEKNEVELLILVTPEFVDAIEPCDVPCGGPGFFTTSPNNHDLYCGGHLEVPTHCNPIRDFSACNDDCGAGCNAGGGCNTCGHAGGNFGGPMGGPMGGNMNGRPMPLGDSVISDGMPLPGGTGYDESYSPTPAQS